MSQAVKKWTEERTSTLESMVDKSVTVSTSLVAELAETLEVTVRSIASKLRNMNYDVEVANPAKTWPEEDATELTNFLANNEGTYTYAEVAAAVLGGKYDAKQVQGKVLSLELTTSVKKSPKAETVKTYSDAEEAQLLSLLKQDCFIEDIAETMGRTVNQIRGKVLSMTRTNADISFPKQKNYAEAVVDALDALEGKAEMTVKEIAEAIDKTERGVKTMLTRRGITVADYDGAAKASKNAEAKVAE